MKIIWYVENLSLVSRQQSVYFPIIGCINIRPRELWESVDKCEAA